MMHDYVIIGGGIAGLYTCYQLLKKHPHASILLLEKSNRLGGRIYTYKDKHFSVEAGAGRFSDDHPLLFSLLKELRLQRYASHASTNSVYIQKETATMHGSTNDAPPSSNSVINEIADNIPSLDRVTNHMLDTYLGQPILPNAGLIAKTILASFAEPADKLRNMNFITYAKDHLTESQIQYIKNSFGYYSELVIMNAYDALSLMNQLGPINTFYTMKGGLEQIIDRITPILKENNVKIKINHEVYSIKHITEIINVYPHFVNGQPFFEIIAQNKKTQKTHTYHAKKCICALPRPALEPLRIFSPIINSHIRKVKCEPLCRIYAKFDPDPHTRKVWFHDLPKATTNSNLRMIIPIDTKTGVIMISYTDNIYAQFWKKIYEKRNIDELSQRIMEYIRPLFPDKNIPPPKQIKVFYWNCGVGYWGIGANSQIISEEILQPFPNMDLYICGENYSQKYQQWIEGALETANKVVELI
jgi:monoamine oxidase